MTARDELSTALRRACEGEAVNPVDEQLRDIDSILADEDSISGKVANECADLTRKILYGEEHLRRVLDSLTSNSTRLDPAKTSELAGYLAVVTVAQNLNSLAKELAQGRSQLVLRVADEVVSDVGDGAA